ncbi:MAG TPA: hypothetical protein VNU66_02045 [Mycobacteriales bacterium]|nr:hypothetical protein [Mycobacteriales bacterium]
MTTQLPSPSLGRYAAADPGSARRRVELRHVPVQLLLAAREHHDALMRELRLLALQEQEGRVLPPELQQLVRELGARWSAPAQRADETFEAAAARGVQVLDPSRRSRRRPWTRCSASTTCSRSPTAWRGGGCS